MRAAAALVLALVSLTCVGAACGASSEDGPVDGAGDAAAKDPVSETGSSGSSEASPGGGDSPETIPDASLESEGAIVWSLVDAVPAYRKPGVLIKAGLVYEAVLDDRLTQSAANLTLEGASRAMFAIAPAASPGPADIVRASVGELGEATIGLFAIDAAGDLVVFTHGADQGICEAWVSETDMFASFGFIDDYNGVFRPSSAQCRPATPTPAGLAGRLPTSGPWVAFGLLIEVADRIEPIAVQSLRLERSDAAFGDELIITTANEGASMVSRSTDPSDDAALDLLHIRGWDGSERTVERSADGAFRIARNELVGPVQMYIDDIGLRNHPGQGSWVDVGQPVADLVIDLAPAFEVTDTSPDRASADLPGPHRLVEWNGFARMSRQEYRGFNFTNNLGFSDRDRMVENTNGCVRVAVIGGSNVALMESRVDEKPALVAEAELAVLRPDRCVEVFSVGQRPNFSIENHYANVRRLVEEFGVSLIIVSAHGGDVCELSDDFYREKFGVDPTTPLRWRFLDGEFVAPVRRQDATRVETDPNFDLSDVCNFQSLDAPESPRPVMEKLVAITEVYESFGAAEVLYFNDKHPLWGNAGATEDMLAACDVFDLECRAMDVVRDRNVPEGVDDHSQFLYRYAEDGHPNARGLQLIGRSLATLIDEELTRSGR